ncbi:MAG: ZPR1 zinc finger domain-containing protein [archaeon]
MKKTNKMKLAGKCPVCGSDLEYSWSEENIPYFGNILITLLKCKCGYKSSDAISTDEKAPYHGELKVSKKTLNTRIVKSSTGNVRIPELGVDISSGPASEGYVSNAEGVLNRIEEAIGSRRGGAKVKKMMADVRAGKKTVTLIIDDPKGNSFIVKAER